MISGSATNQPYFLKNVEAMKQPESILNIKYGISGDRTIGAHPPFINESTGVDGARQELIFKSIIVLQRPVLDPCLAVGFLPLPSDGLRVGQLVKMQWRVERLKDLNEKEISEQNVSTTVNREKSVCYFFQHFYGILYSVIVAFELPTSFFTLRNFTSSFLVK